MTTFGKKSLHEIMDVNEKGGVFLERKNKEKNMNDLNIKINGDISEDLLNMKLTDMFCKHAIRRNPDDTQIKAGKLYIESCKLGYKVCDWGLHVGHVSDSIITARKSVDSLLLEYNIR